MMYRIPNEHDEAHSYLDIPNVLEDVDGFVYLDEYTNEPHIVVEYKDHYVDYRWHEEFNTYYWVDKREISAAEFATKPHNVDEAKRQMYYYLTEKSARRMQEFNRVHYGNRS